ncbi:MAG TPA: sugar ABC transporter permease [Treponema sp.]|mgnify:FL=1|jgi:putative multiple sugar transport system permease protein|uniref:multiple monosaccharide ABC transporter permease n=1 Tax=Gracilinema caldarium TaxID=215591 RepID=UPI0016A03BDD|nr:multiple monosaccharide ABC transporter permease [Gracilinema caldarium]NLJ10691.1 sugar ABC transporter permease [Treponema sp.]HON13136.1 sugar ABC transporter permease [Treponema sp.]HPC71009.1 sugar ABC transporter permease [Treponema sp.]HRS03446.1 sugar ABC transporter permease [Treponema sp.]HRU27962.1 sugar ABC transporter permease [Treponema sp.]
MSDTAMKSTSIRNLIKANIRNYSMVLMLALIMIIFAFLTNGVNLNSRNFTNIFMQNSYILILAVGMVLIIIVGNIDLSVGSVAAFIGAISAMLYNSGANIFVTILVSIIIGILIGAFQGVWIAYAKIPAFIVTLAAQLLFRGLTYIITNVTPISLRDDNFKQIASGMANIDALTVNGVYYTALIAGIVVFLIYLITEIQGRKSKLKYGFTVSPLSFFIIKILVIGLLIMGLSQRFSTYRGIPIVVIVLGVTIILFSFIANNTVIGRYIYAVGGNARSAKLSGINSELVVFIVQLIMGGLTGLAGVVFTGYMNSALPQAGNNFELDAIAACFIGGASASGGIGTVIGAIVGGLVMAVINNGMSLMNIQAQWQYVVKALVLLLAVFYDIYTRRKTGLG